jgi:hypothetical protein
MDWLIREGKNIELLHSKNVNQEGGLFLGRVWERHCTIMKHSCPLEATLPHSNTNSHMNELHPSRASTCVSPTSGPE